MDEPNILSVFKHMKARHRLISWKTPRISIEKAVN